MFLVIVATSWRKKTKCLILSSRPGSSNSKSFQATDSNAQRDMHSNMQSQHIATDTCITHLQRATLTTQIESTPSFTHP